MKRTRVFMAVMTVALIGAMLLSAGPGLPSPNKTLQPGPITNLPATITLPGYYYLTGNLSSSGTSDGITVSSDNVTIDLMGFCLSGPGSTPGSTSGAVGITGQRDYYNLQVRNGSLTDWFVGFQAYERNSALNLRVENCSEGIRLRGGLVKDCTVVTTGLGVGIINYGVTTGNIVSNCARGIYGQGTVSGNYVSNCSYAGIEGRPGTMSGNGGSGTISGNSIRGCANGILVGLGASVIGNTVYNESESAIGIKIDTSDPCLVTQNTVSGVGAHFSQGSATVIGMNAGF